MSVLYLSIEYCTSGCSPVHLGIARARAAPTFPVCWSKGRGSDSPSCLVSVVSWFCHFFLFLFLLFYFWLFTNSRSRALHQKKREKKTVPGTKKIKEPRGGGRRTPFFAVGSLRYVLNPRPPYPIHRPLSQRNGLFWCTVLYILLVSIPLLKLSKGGRPGWVGGHDSFFVSLVTMYPALTASGVCRWACAGLLGPRTFCRFSVFCFCFSYIDVCLCSYCCCCCCFFCKNKNWL